MKPTVLDIVACMLKNTQTGQYHPIIFRWSPMPCGRELKSVLGGIVERFRSVGHDPNGFKTKDLAIDSVKEKCVVVDREWEWNGDGIPAMTEFFEIETGGLNV